jgi:hypothetical protein
MTDQISDFIAGARPKIILEHGRGPRARPPRD